ncbi:MAG: OmpA family protein, partial [Bacteroidales bacterium]|nr:OmpA family protein [Bacteroidales bacterium]
ASNRPGGLGGLDLYVSERIGGDWGPAVNLGPVVNTAMDEEGPFIDGGTLYFSSTGHNGWGGYDIFKTTLNGATWSTPENLGKPINSTSDDVFWSTAKDGKSYFASDRANGSGASDLYVCGSSSLLANVEARLQGTVTHCAKPLPASTISIRDNSTGIESEITPNSDGSFEIVAYRGHNYSLSATCAGNVVFDDMFDVSVNAPSSSEYKTIKLDPGVECPVVADVETPVTSDNGNEYVVEIRDLNFAFAKADAIVSNSDLDKLAEYLKANKNAKVQLGGYCDATGSAKLNATLGKKRADAVKTYLTKQGVKSTQLAVVGFGEENPISLNKVGGDFDESAKQYNRRVEVEVLNQGEGKPLVIRPLNNIPQRFKSPDYKVNGYVKAKGYPETEK